MEPPTPRAAPRPRRGTTRALLASALLLGAFALWRATTSREGDSPTAPAGVVEEREAAPDPVPPALARAPRPASTAPSAAAPAAPGSEVPKAPADRLTDEAFRALETEVGSGRIEGIVMAGTRPRGGGHARLWPDYMARTFGGARGPPPMATTPIAADGTFLLEGIPPGTYGLEIASEGVAVRLVNFSMPDPPGKTRRIVLALELGGVAGRVFDRIGKPAIGAVVHVNPAGGSRGSEMNCETRVGADGAYEIGGLPAGAYWIETHLGADWWTARDDRTLTFRAKDGEVVHLDLGSERGDPLWTGILRTAAGKVVRGPGEIVIERPGSFDTTPFDAEGAFAKRLAPGTVRVTAVLPGLDDLRRVRIPTDVIISDRDMAQDLVLPGTRVSGVVKVAASGRILEGDRNQIASVIPEGKDHHSRRSVAVSMDGSFVFDGVVPGRYVLSGWPAALRDTSRGTITFDVPDGVPEVVVEAWAGGE